MGWTLRRATAAALTLIAFSASLSIAKAATNPDLDRVRGAIAYLQVHQKQNGSIPAFSPIGSTADAILAFSAAGMGKSALRAALAFLRTQVRDGNVSSIGSQAKVVAAIVAAGRDPRAFGGKNLVRAIRETLGADGRFGDAAVFDDALATIALEGATVQVPSRAIHWLLDAQCADGGWQYDDPAGVGDDEHCLSSTGSPDPFRSDTNTTSYVVQAIQAAGGASYAHDPFAYFGSIRDPKHGGWGYSWGVELTDANSTALVIQAYVAARRVLPSGAMGALRALQDPTCGGWAFTWGEGASGPRPGDPNVGATIGAVLGILRQPLPVPSGTVHGEVPPIPGCG